MYKGMESLLIYVLAVISTGCIIFRSENLIIKIGYYLLGVFR